MNSIGRTIQCLRKAKGVTQEKMAQQIGVTFQAISKWENEYTMPDIMLLPVIAEYFGISIDDLFHYRWSRMTAGEKLADVMLKNGVIRLLKPDPACGGKLRYHVISERFATSMQLTTIGELLAACLMEKHVAFDAVVGVAYHGIGFAASTAIALQNRYGITTNFCFDRLTPDKRGREICGYTLCDGDRIVVIDDVIGSGREMAERIERLREQADVQIVAMMAVAEIRGDQLGRKRLEKEYGAKVFSLLDDADIRLVLEKDAAVN